MGSRQVLLIQGDVICSGQADVAGTRCMACSRCGCRGQPVPYLYHVWMSRWVALRACLCSMMTTRPYRQQGASQLVAAIDGVIAAAGVVSAAVVDGLNPLAFPLTQRQQQDMFAAAVFTHVNRWAAAFGITHDCEAVQEDRAKSEMLSRLLPVHT